MLAARLPFDFLDSIAKVHLANDLVLFAVVAIDTARHRRLHPAFLWGSAFLVALQTLSAWLSAHGLVDAHRPRNYEQFSVMFGHNDYH